MYSTPRHQTSKTNFTVKIKDLGDISTQMALV